jgi:diaminopimelate decarboxylase
MCFFTGLLESRTPHPARVRRRLFFAGHFLMSVVDPFRYVNGRLHAEGVALDAIAREHGTPVYVYSRAAIESRYRAIEAALHAVAHRVCYAVKANGNLAVLNVLARLGAGFDIVSGGELERVIAAGGDPAKVVFSGVGKRRDEMHQALRAGVACFNVESEGELDALASVAAGEGGRAPVSLRVNPDVDARTHPYISTGLKRNKFGIAIEQAEALYRRAAADPALDVRGVACHIGSQLTDAAPVMDALERVLALVDRLQAAGIRLRHLDMGGGFGIRYRDETPLAAHDFAAAIAARMHGRALELVLEPGRSIVGEAGALLTRVLYAKHNGGRGFLVADAAMNDLIRPALYQGWHPVWPIDEASTGGAGQSWDLVGPVCESADFLALERTLAAGPGDLLAVGCCGAYGFAMSSNYNARPRAAEVMVDRDRCHLVRPREQVSALFAGEQRLPD